MSFCLLPRSALFLWTCKETVYLNCHFLLLLLLASGLGGEETGFTFRLLVHNPSISRGTQQAPPGAAKEPPSQMCSFKTLPECKTALKSQCLALKLVLVNAMVSVRSGPGWSGSKKALCLQIKKIAITYHHQGQVLQVGLKIALPTAWSQGSHANPEWCHHKYKL